MSGVGHGVFGPAGLVAHHSWKHLLDVVGLQRISPRATGKSKIRPKTQSNQSCGKKWLLCLFLLCCYQSGHARPWVRGPETLKIGGASAPLLCLAQGATPTAPPNPTTPLCKRGTHRARAWLLRVAQSLTFFHPKWLHPSNGSSLQSCSSLSQCQKMVSMLYIQ